MEDRCPCCRRPLEKMRDYPLIFVRKVEIRPVPEVIDYWSAEALRARQAHRQPPQEEPLNQAMRLEGINRTPDVAAAYHSDAMQSYFRTLQGYQGQEVSPTELLPPLQSDTYFKWAFPIPGSRLYLSFSEAVHEGAERICEVVLYGRGPNFGSAGGPTLQPFGAVAAIHYEGHLVGPCGRDRYAG